MPRDQDLHHGGGDTDDDSDNGSDESITVYGSSWGSMGQPDYYTLQPGSDSPAAHSSAQDLTSSRNSSISDYFPKSPPDKYPLLHSPPRSGISQLRQGQTFSSRNDDIRSSDRIPPPGKERLDRDGLKPRSTGGSRRPSHSSSHTKPKITATTQESTVPESRRNTQACKQCECEPCKEAGVDEYKLRQSRTAQNRLDPWDQDLRLDLPAHPRPETFGDSPPC